MTKRAGSPVLHGVKGAKPRILTARTPWGTVRCESQHLYTHVVVFPEGDLERQARWGHPSVLDEQERVFYEDCLAAPDAPLAEAERDAAHITTLHEEAREKLAVLRERAAVRERLLAKLAGTTEVCVYRWCESEALAAEALFHARIGGFHAVMAQVDTEGNGA